MLDALGKVRAHTRPRRGGTLAGHPLDDGPPGGRPSNSPILGTDGASSMVTLPTTWQRRHSVLPEAMTAARSRTTPTAYVGRDAKEPALWKEAEQAKPREVGFPWTVERGSSFQPV